MAGGKGDLVTILPFTKDQVVVCTMATHLSQRCGLGLLLFEELVGGGSHRCRQWNGQGEKDPGHPPPPSTLAPPRTRTSRAARTLGQVGARFLRRRSRLRSLRPRPQPAVPAGCRLQAWFPPCRLSCSHRPSAQWAAEQDAPLSVGLGNTSLGSSGSVYRDDLRGGPRLGGPLAPA